MKWLRERVAEWRMTPEQRVVQAKAEMVERRRNLFLRAGKTEEEWALWEKKRLLPQEEQCRSTYRGERRDYECLKLEQHGTSHKNPALSWGWSVSSRDGKANANADFWARRGGSVIVPGRWYHEWIVATEDEDNIAADGSNWPTRGVRCTQCGEFRANVFMRPGETSSYGKGFWPGQCPGPQKDVAS